MRFSESYVCFGTEDEDLVVVMIILVTIVADLDRDRAATTFSSLKSTASLTATATFSDSLYVFPTTLESLKDPDVLVARAGEFHMGSVTGVDLMEGGSDVVSVGEDGRINLVRVFDEEWFSFL